MYKKIILGFLALLFLSSTTLAATFTVITTADAGTGSLRWAITEANKTSATDTIAFNIPNSMASVESGYAYWSIKPLTVLPSITETIIIDGSTQPTSGAYNNPYGPEIEINGELFSYPNNNFEILKGADNCVLKGLVFNRFGSGGDVKIKGDYNKVYGCYFGIDVTAETTLLNPPTLYLNGSYNLVGSTESSGRNIFFSDAQGNSIEITPDYSDSSSVSIRNEVLGNYFGINNRGNFIKADKPNGGNQNSAIAIYNPSHSNKVGNGMPGGGNVINNAWNGIEIMYSSSNEVKGNYIGTNLVGENELISSYMSAGIYIRKGNFNLIGGKGPLDGNVITKNDVGIDIYASYNSLLGNYIGTNKSGNKAIPNYDGIRIVEGKYNQIGDGTSSGKNIISGNDGQGIYMGQVYSPNEDIFRNEVVGNYIGVGANGSLPLGNKINGIYIRQNTSYSKHKTLYNKIGPGNIIANNGNYGIELQAETSYEVITKNLIYNNTKGGIYLDLKSNFGITPPTITSAYYQSGNTTVSGTWNTKYSGGVIEVFEKSSSFKASTEVDASGNWSVIIGSTYPGNVVVATGTYDHNTSAFSAPQNVVPSTAAPDIQIATTETYLGDNTYNSTAAGQTIITTINTGESKTYYFKVENDGNLAGDFVISAEVSSNMDWQVKFYTQKVGGADITNAITTTGWPISNLASGASREIRAEITNSGTSLSTAEVSVIFKNNTGTLTSDKAKAIITAHPIYYYRVDNLIGNTTSSYIGNNIYNTTALNQTLTRTVTMGSFSTYYVKIENDSNLADSYLVTAEISSTTGFTNQWWIKFYEGSSNIGGSLLNGTWQINNLLPGQSRTIRITVDSLNTNLSTSEVIIRTRSLNSSETDAVKARFTVIPSRPDNLVATNETYFGNDLYNSTALNQTITKSSIAGTTQIFYLKMQNDAQVTDNFRVSTTANNNSDWQIKIYDAKTGGSNVTSYLLGKTVIASSVTPEAFQDFRVELTSNTTITKISTVELEFTTTSLSDTSKTDKVKAVAIASPIPVYLPDNLIATSETYLGNNIYNLTAKDQTVISQIASGAASVIFVKIENDGNGSDNYLVTAEVLADTNWTATFYDQKSGGTNITSSMTGSGWQINSHKEIRIELKHSGSTYSTAEVNVITTSLTQKSKADKVKAIVSINTNYYYRPDVLVRVSGEAYVGDKIYADTHIIKQETTTYITTGETAVFYFKVKNNGNAPDNIKILLDLGNSTAGTVTEVYDLSNKGQMVNSLNLGQIFSFYAGEEKEFRIEHSIAGPIYTTFYLNISATSMSDSSKMDQVRCNAKLREPNQQVSSVSDFEFTPPGTGVIANKSGVAFQIKAKDSGDNTIASFSNNIELLVDQGTVSPPSIYANEFYNGVWMGSLKFDTPGERTLTIRDGSITVTKKFSVKNQSRTYNSTDLGITSANIIVPEGIAVADITLSMSEINPPANAPQNFRITRSKAFSITGPVTTFSSPITVTIPIESWLTKAPEVYYLDGSTWKKDGINVTSYNNSSVTFTTTHLTVFAAMTPAVTYTVGDIRFGPNPFNPENETARFWYVLGEDKDTSIYLIDLTGNVVFRGEYLAGTPGGSSGVNSIEFDGMSHYGEMLTNGVYLYKIVQRGQIIGGGKVSIIR